MAFDHRATGGFQIPTKQILWPRSKTRRASINNFGFGGSNAHFILEQAPKLESFSPNGAVVAERILYQQRISEMIIPEADLGKCRRLVVLSGGSEASVKALPEALYITSNTDLKPFTATFLAVWQ